MVDLQEAGVARTKHLNTKSDSKLRGCTREKYNEDASTASGRRYYRNVRLALSMMVDEYDVRTGWACSRRLVQLQR